jgi:hypothetical protein
MDVDELETSGFHIMLHSQAHQSIRNGTRSTLTLLLLENFIVVRAAKFWQPTYSFLIYRIMMMQLILLVMYVDY